MKYDLRKLLVMLSKQTLYALILLGLGRPLLFAEGSYGQSIHEVQVSLTSGNLTIEEALLEIENHTNFTFAYGEDVRSIHEKLDLFYKKKSVAVVLSDITQKTGVVFRQINKTISAKADPNFKEPQANEVVVAPDVVVTGTVTDDAGEPLIGVNIMVKGTSTGTVTDLDGNYRLSVPEGEVVLLFSSIGFKSTEVVLGNRTSINVQMEPDMQQLGEVVITGYGTQERGEVSGSISSIGSAQMENVPAGSLDKVMQGKAPGVQVNSSNGLPGGATEVRIRGVGSVNAGNQPLYIIDGVQVTSTNRNRSIASFNPLSGINPNDIASVDILKDAAAASIYGAQAGNGVVIITTKSGIEGKAKINLNTYVGFTEILNKPELLDGPGYVTLLREAGVNSGNLNAAHLIDLNYGDPASNQTYDWLDAVTRKGALRNYELSASGGTDKVHYYVAGSYSDQEYQFIGYDFQRGTFKANMDAKLTDRLTVDTKINLSRILQNSGDAPSFQLYNTFVTALGIRPTDPIYDEDGSYNTNLDIWDNPLQDNEQNKIQGLTNQVIGNMSLNYAITDYLKFRSSYSLEYTNLNEELFYDPRNSAGVGTDGLVRFGSSNTFNWQTDQTLTYNRTFANAHEVSGLVGFNFRNETFTTQYTEGIGVATPQFGETLTGTTPNSITSTYSQYKLAGLFARVGYTYNDKYIFQATLRRDGSSRFGANNKFGYFPAVSAAWRIGDESFMEGVGFISDLKLRASYGETGNSQFITENQFTGRSVAAQIESNFPALSLFNSVADASYNGNAGIVFSQLGNADLGWERNVTQNFGVDYGFINNRIYGSVDYFIRRTEDLLLSRPLPSTSGFTNIAQNVGSLENRGWEIGISTNNFVGDFKWTTDFNVTFLKNEVLDLGGQDLPDENLWVGHPVGEQWLVPWAGINPADGRPMWYDADGNITYNPLLSDRRFGIGSSLVPDYYGGITNTFSYKGFELTAFFQYQVGNIQHDQPTAYLLSDFRYSWNQLATNYDRWTTPGQVTDVPLLYSGATQPGTASSIFGNNGTGDSDRFWDNASYIRLKTLTLGYTFPQEMISKIKLNKLRVYLQGYNLWTGTKYSGLDPEFAAGSYNMGSAPQGKSYMAGLQIGL